MSNVCFYESKHFFLFNQYLIKIEQFDAIQLIMKIYAFESDWS